MSLEDRRRGTFMDIPALVRMEMEHCIDRAAAASELPFQNAANDELCATLTAVVLGHTYPEAFINFWAYNVLWQYYIVNPGSGQVLHCLGSPSYEESKGGPFVPVRDKEQADTIIRLRQDWNCVERNWSLQEKYKKLPPALVARNLTDSQKDELDALCKLRNRIAHAKFMPEPSSSIELPAFPELSLVEPDALEEKLAGFYSVREEGFHSWQRIYTVDCARWAHRLALSLARFLRDSVPFSPADAFLE